MNVAPNTQLREAAALLAAYGYSVIAPTDRPGDNTMSPNEVAERWNVALRTVYRQIKSGKLRAFKVGKNYRIYDSDVQAYERGETV